MYALSYVTPEEAAAAQPQDTTLALVQRIYAAYAEVGVPEPLQLLSVSPAMLERQFDLMRYFRDHEALSFPLLAAIRYAVARAQQYDCCTDFNCALLQRCGMNMPDIEDLYAFVSDKAGTAPDSGLEEREQQLVRFVVQATLNRDAEPVDNSQAIENLRQSGWTDRDIFDAMNHAASMVTIALMDKTFRTTSA